MYSALKAFEICFKIFHVFIIKHHICYVIKPNILFNYNTKYEKPNSLIKQVTN